MKASRSRRREIFLVKMTKEADASYDVPYREWYQEEKEFIRTFISLVGSPKRILDLAGGYAKAVPVLLEGGNSVVLADLSLKSLRDGRADPASCGAQFVRLNMLAELPFVDGAFDGVWFAEAFEYVPPDERMEFLATLRRIVKREGIVFLSAEGLSKDVTLISYVKNYLYWKVVRRAPVIWGEYIYMLDLPGYKGWHYHSLVLSSRIERCFRTAGFEIVKSSRTGEGEYSMYILRAT